MRSMLQETDMYMQRRTAANSAARWVALNELTRRLFRGLGSRYIVARYEDIVTDPSQELGRIRSRIGLDGTLTMLDDHTVNLRTTHTSWGNGMRFATGPLALRIDDEWATQLSAGDRRRVERITSLTRRQYGY
jgi:hypothetical protein